MPFSEGLLDYRPLMCRGVFSILPCPVECESPSCCEYDRCRRCPWVGLWGRSTHGGQVVARLYGPLPVDRWIVGSVVSATAIVTGWQVLGVAARVSGLPMVHVLLLSGMLMLIYLVVRRSGQTLPEFKDWFAAREEERSLRLHGGG